MQFFVPPSFSNKSLLFVCLFVQVRVAIKTVHIKVLSHTTNPKNQHFSTTTLKFLLAKCCVTISIVCSHPTSPRHLAPTQLDRATETGNQHFRQWKQWSKTRNNGVKLIVKHFNTSVTKHFYPIKITTTWNTLPNKVVTSITVNSFKNSLDKHWAENLPNVRVNWQQSLMPCTIQVCTNSRRPAFSQKWTQRCVLRLLLTTTTTTT